MPRVAKIFAVDLPHHITQRGNYQRVSKKNLAVEVVKCDRPYEKFKRVKIVIGKHFLIL